MVRSQEEVANEIAILEDLRGKIPPYNAFGDSNLAQIDAQITALRSKDFSVSCEEDEDDVDCDSVLDLKSALDVCEAWFTGDDDEAPHEGWEGLVGMTVTPITPVTASETGY